jgi:hypothetical protein
MFEYFNNQLELITFVEVGLHDFELGIFLDESRIVLSVGLEVCFVLVILLEVLFHDFISCRQIILLSGCLL